MRETVDELAVYKSGYLLETLSISCYYLTIRSLYNRLIARSENALSADNQQERPGVKLGYYIAGFVDGEGSFHVAIQKSKNVRLGVQVIPEFHVSQNANRTATLELLQKTLDCGYIKPNHRKRLNDRSNVLVVRNHQHLKNKVIPFFKKYKIISCKNEDFIKFTDIVTMIGKGCHLQKKGLIRILKIAFSMNEGGRYRKIKYANVIKHLESSETVRQS